MARRSRIIVPGELHHITQRGSRRQTVFFEDSDFQFYLDLLDFYARKYEVEVLAYCLMTNHVHHGLVPANKGAIRWTLQLVHERYAAYVNKRMGWTGHLWQERFYSCPVENDRFWGALKYIERNPVEAKMVDHAADYRWSSAAAHCGIREDKILTSFTSHSFEIKRKENWYEWLREEASEIEIKSLRQCTMRDLPCGSDEFLDDLEKLLGHSVRPAKRGRPKKG